MLALLFFTLSIGQSSADGAGAPQDVVEPRWLEPPRVDTSPWRYRRGLESATATIICRAKADGRVDQCQIAAESPPDSGLGRTLILAARKARVDTATLGPSGSEARIAFTANYQLEYY